MRITNLTGDKILCLIDEKSFVLDHKQNITIEAFEVAKFFHESTSYSIKECSNSSFLKLLSFFDDPFQLRREYHLVVDVEITNFQFYNSKELTITANTAYADIETRTYYEYFVLKCDGKQVLPNRVYMADVDRISADFTRNSRNIVRWNAVWNVLIEPILFELVGYFVIYQLFTLWIGAAAWYAVSFLIILNILIEIVILIFKTKTKRKNKFYHYLDESVIHKICYINPLGA